MAKTISERFQEETRYTRGQTFDWHLDSGARPELYKTYPEAERVSLPDPTASPSMPLAQILTNRKSRRRYTSEPITIDELSFMLWACAGIREEYRGMTFRTAPSAGALYPIETYIVVNNVDGLAQGLYHYGVEDHCLEVIALGNLAKQTSEAALGQEMCAQSAVTFIWTAVFQRTKWKYGERSQRYIYLDAGHVAENLALSAVALGLGSCQIAALFDDEVNALVGVDGASEGVVYMSSVGRVGS